MMKLNDGICGEVAVLSEDAVMEMRTDRASHLPGNDGRGYGLGLAIMLPEDDSDPTIFHHGGMYGTQAWYDTERGYGAFLTLQIFPSAEGVDLSSELRPLVEAAIDNPN
jgi:CubicO group peptidase (beta-lactamase class C family)